MTRVDSMYQTLDCSLLGYSIMQRHGYHRERGIGAIGGSGLGQSSGWAWVGLRVVLTLARPHSFRLSDIHLDYRTRMRDRYTLSRRNDDVLVSLNVHSLRSEGSANRL